MNKLGISIGPRNLETIPAYAAAGFEVMEISLPNQPLEQLERFGERALTLARQNGIDLWSVHLPFGQNLDISQPEDAVRLAVLDRLSEIIALARQWGAHTLVVHGSSEPIEDAQRDARIGACGQSLKTLQAAAGSMRLALENLPRTCIARVSGETVPLAQNCAGICFDVNHLLMQTHENFLLQAANAIITTHLSDYDGNDEKHWIPGAGVVPWKLVYERLTEAHYAGPWLFELGANPAGGEYDPEQVISRWKKASGID